ncbi:hypothetical protein GIS00_06605 [Nakamurella sp. YIM 132087]|uniref:Uncharacterized protein n=1 Tax=Nakamurella alba TaxID=2665158 RepID=A0A7K1FK39_9ACTN|nr:hypothetical protein [Nakamurella alba]MTD13613.1 hypothetical protein [Nakamurella alba]
MALFRRRRRPTLAAPASVGPADAGDLAAVQREWANGLETSAALTRWREAMRDYPDTPPERRMVIADGLGQGLRHVLLGDGLPVPESEVAESARRMLWLLDRAPDDPTVESQTYALYRLALHVVRIRGWQPDAWGGDHTVTVDPGALWAPARLVAALEPGGPTDADAASALARFFAGP